MALSAATRGRGPAAVLQQLAGALSLVEQQASFARAGVELAIPTGEHQELQQGPSTSYAPASSDDAKSQQRSAKGSKPWLQRGRVLASGSAHGTHSSSALRSMQPQAQLWPSSASAFGPDPASSSTHGFRGVQTATKASGPDPEETAAELASAFWGRGLLPPACSLQLAKLELIHRSPLPCAVIVLMGLTEMCACRAPVQ